jgi:ABC-type transport system involved in multi-copper enzyme maturation permease subunit
MPSFQFISFCILLTLVQGLAALPWLLAIDLRTRERVREPKTWFIGFAVCLAIGVGAALLLDLHSDRGVLGGWGRVYMSLLQVQLAADLLVLIFLGMLLVWPKGGAVALAAFREGVRQPMFWMLASIASVLMLLSPFLPYFTFGEDMKMVRELCFAFTMLFSLLFGVASASISVHEEIEGRTAVTLMSKPISRRQFLLGKFWGILLSALAMTMLLGWVLVWTFIFKEFFDGTADEQTKVPDPAWVTSLENLFNAGSSADLLRGIGLWMNDAAIVVPFLALGFCQVMVLIAATVALATRLPVVVTLPFVIIIFFLGHLAPIMTEVTQNQFALVHFVAQLFETVLPSLNLFDVGSALIRDMPLPPGEYAMYAANVTLYALIYTCIALLFGLILFEDRDLA